MNDHMYRTSCIIADLAILITFAFTFSSTRARNAAFGYNRLERDEIVLTIPPDLRSWFRISLTSDTFVSFVLWATISDLS